MTTQTLLDIAKTRIKAANGNTTETQFFEAIYSALERLAELECRQGDRSEPDGDNED